MISEYAMMISEYSEQYDCPTGLLYEDFGCPICLTSSAYAAR